METGKVKFYNKEKKYGFITGDDGKDYFFHASGVSNEIYLKDYFNEQIDDEHMIYGDGGGIDSLMDDSVPAPWEKDSKNEL